MKKAKPMYFKLLELPDDMLSEILAKVGEHSFDDFLSCILSSKAFLNVAKYHNVLRKLNLCQVFPPPWEKISKQTSLLYACAEAKNPHALFLCGLIELFFMRNSISGIKHLTMAAFANHPEAMYLYGMILIRDNQLTAGSYLIKKLWRDKGLLMVRLCQKNLQNVVLEMTVRQYHDYDILLSQIEVGEECTVGDFNEVCESCLIYKEIFRFIDYMHYV